MRRRPTKAFKERLWVLVGMAAVILVGIQPVRAEVDPSRYDLRVGYGWQYTNGARPNNIQLISLLPSLVVPLGGDVGPRWFRGRGEWNPEINLALFNHPYARPLFGFTPMQFRWSWEIPCRFKPYIFGGAGVLRANINRRETRSRTNFNVQMGFGTYVDLNDATSLILEYRHIHISNAGLDEDNAGANMHTFLAGISVKK